LGGDTKTDVGITTLKYGSKTRAFPDGKVEKLSPQASDIIVRMGLDNTNPQGKTYRSFNVDQMNDFAAGKIKADQVDRASTQTHGPRLSEQMEKAKSDIEAERKPQPSGPSSGKGGGGGGGGGVARGPSPRGGGGNLFGLPQLW